MSNAQFLLDENDKDLARLGSTVSKLKHIALEIGQSIEESSTLVEDIDHETTKTQLLLDNAMLKFKSLKEKSKGTIALWMMVGLTVFATCALYFLV
jgi:hypothetical protein